LDAESVQPDRNEIPHLLNIFECSTNYVQLGLLSVDLQIDDHLFATIERRYGPRR
jgi:hypothetical protein